jgi:hypothetical protein
MSKARPKRPAATVTGAADTAVLERSDAAAGLHRLWHKVEERRLKDSDFAIDHLLHKGRISAGERATGMRLASLFYACGYEGKLCASFEPPVSGSQTSDRRLIAQDTWRRICRETGQRGAAELVRVCGLNEPPIDVATLQRALRAADRAMTRGH